MKITPVAPILMLAVVMSAATSNDREEKVGPVTFRGTITEIDPNEQVHSMVLATTGLRRDSWTIMIRTETLERYRCDLSEETSLRLEAGDQIAAKGDLYRKLELSYQDENGKRIYPARNVYQYTVKKCRITDDQRTKNSVTNSVTGSLVSRVDLPDQNRFEFVIRDFVDGVRYTCSGSPILRIYSDYAAGDTMTVRGGASLPEEGTARINSCHVVSHGPGISK